MKFKVIVFFIILGILTLFSCEYEFSEDSFTEITQKPPTASVNLNSLRNNHVFYVSTIINFNYNGNNKHRLYEIKIYIDETLIKTSTINSGDFNIDTESLEDGSHILKVEYIFSSGSGSLADVSGVEAYIKTEEYNFTVDKSPPEAVVMKSAKIIDGSIYLTWKPINKINFDKAYLSISDKGGKITDINRSISLSKGETLRLNYNDISFYETKYSQEQSINLKYQINLENTRGKSESNEVSISIAPFNIQKLIFNENSYKLIIPEHTLYGNFDYFLFKHNNKSHEIPSNGGEVIINKPIKFPSYEAGTLLTLFKKNIGQDTYKGSLFILGSYDKQFEYDTSNSYEEFVYNESNGFVYTLRVYSSCVVCLDRISIDRRNPEDLTIIDSKQISIVEDYNNQELIIDPSTGNLIIDSGSVTFLVDKNNFSILNQWTLSEFGEQNGNIFYRNNIIAIEQNDKVSFFDSNTKSLFYTTNKTGYFKISESGKYFYTNNSIFKLENKLVNLITNTSTNNSVNLVEFIENSNLCVYNTYDGNPIIYDFASQSKTVLNDFTGINIIDYDNTTGKLLLVKNDDTQNNRGQSYAYVYDFTTADFKKIEVQTLGTYTNSPPQLKGYWLASDKLISVGYYLDHYLNE